MKPGPVELAIRTFNSYVPLFNDTEANWTRNIWDGSYSVMSRLQCIEKKKNQLDKILPLFFLFTVPSKSVLPNACIFEKFLCKRN